MSAEQKQNKPDFTQGVAASSVADGAMVVGRVGKADVLLTRQGGEWFAVGAHCTHYRGPLAKGLIVGDTIRCPLHHACFNLRTGEAVQAPAFDPIACWRLNTRATRCSCGTNSLRQRQPPAPFHLRLRSRS